MSTGEPGLTGGPVVAPAPPAAATAAATPHIVRVGRRAQFSSATLASAALVRLVAGWKSCPWYRDRWNWRGLAAAVAATQAAEAPGGLVLIADRVPFDNPPPFAEFFEPIPLGSWDRRLKTLSGEAPTRQERGNRIALWIVGVIVAVLLVPLALAIIRHGWHLASVLMLGNIVLAAAVIALVVALRNLAGRWYLLPGAVAIVRRWKQGPDRLLLLTPRDAWATIRYVSTGKTVVLVVELRPPTGRRLHTTVSEREAISFLAAWQSPHPPPTRAQLAELLG